MFFNQMTKTDFCSSPTLKQFTINYSIDEMLKTYVLLWCTPQLHLDHSVNSSSHSVNGDIAIQWEWSNFDHS